VPVLTEKAVKATASIENSEVGVAGFCTPLVGVFRIACAGASWAEPPRDAVGRQRVVVPLEDSFFWGSSHSD